MFKNDGELVSLKPRPVTSRVAFYRIKLAIAKTFSSQLARSEYQLGIITILPKIFPLKPLQFTVEYINFSIGGFMPADLSKMAVIRLGLARAYQCISASKIRILRNFHFVTR